MKNLLLFAIFGTLVIFNACKSKSADAAAEKDNYEKTIETLEEKEKKSPVSFLSVSSKDKHNLLGQTVIKGTIKNKAKICVYKDVEIELSFFSKTGVLLEKDTEKIYEAIEPGKSADFKTKYFAPKGSDSVALRILGAQIQ